METGLDEKATGKAIEEAKASEQGAYKTRDMALEAYEKINTRNEELQTLLKDHLEDISVRASESAEEEATDLPEYADSSGCQVATLNPSRWVCACSNLLINDARFCRKCGIEWTDADHANQKPEVSQIAAQISAFGEKICEAEASLSRSKKSLAQTLDTGASRRRPMPLDDVDNPEPVERGDMMLKNLYLQQEANELHQQKLNAEASLLIQRCSEVSKGVGFFKEMQSEQTSSDTNHVCDGMNCKYHKELQAIRAILAAVRSLCAQMAGKLHQTATQNVQMNRAMTSMQQVVAAAAKAVDGHIAGEGDSHELLDDVRKALHEEKNRSVFWRLYENKPRNARRARRLEVELELLEKGYSAIYRQDAAPIPMICGPDREVSATPDKELATVNLHVRQPSPVVQTPRRTTSKPRVIHAQASRFSSEPAAMHTQTLSLPGIAHAPGGLRTPRAGRASVTTERKVMADPGSLILVGGAIPPTPVSRGSSRRRST